MRDLFCAVCIVLGMVFVTAGVCLFQSYKGTVQQRENREYNKAFDDAINSIGERK